MATPFFHRMDHPTQTLYSEFLDRLSMREAQRAIGHTGGAFVRKIIHGHTYIYFQTSLPGGDLRQIYLGRKSPYLERLAGEFSRGKRNQEDEESSMTRLAAQLRSGGALATDPAAARVLLLLAEVGLFRAGGVLVGTHAMAVLGNLLGVRWESAALRTEDIDVAFPHVQLALPPASADLPTALDRLRMGFLPVPALDPRRPSASFKVRGRSLRVDLLTSQRRANEKLVYFPQWNTSAQALPFLDFILEESVPGAIVNGGGVWVRVPAPARFAFHKLIIQGERWDAHYLRSSKDVRQAAQVLAVLVEDRPGDVQEAWIALRARGKGWTSRVKKAMGLVGKENPGVVDDLTRLIPELTK